MACVTRPRTVAAGGVTTATKPAVGRAEPRRAARDLWLRRNGMARAGGLLASDRFVPACLPRALAGGWAPCRRIPYCQRAARNATLHQLSCVGRPPLRAGPRAKPGPGRSGRKIRHSAARQSRLPARARSGPGPPLPLLCTSPALQQRPHKRVSMCIRNCRRVCVDRRPAAAPAMRGRCWPYPSRQAGLATRSRAWMGRGLRQRVLRRRRQGGIPARYLPARRRLVCAGVSALETASRSSSSKHSTRTSQMLL